MASKYKNKRITVKGVTYDSIKEFNRWVYLLCLSLCKEISGLERQKYFVLAPSVVLDGRKKPALRYKADAVYYDKNGLLVVEDTKSEMTRTLSDYRIKKHLMKSVHNIDIKEV